MIAESLEQERLALLRTVLGHPDDDTPRLIYADFLDENGQPERAEFVRSQCSGANILKWCANGNHNETSHLCEWCRDMGLPNVRQQAGDSIWEVRFGKQNKLSWLSGFITLVTGTLEDLMLHLPAIVREHPVQPHESMVADRKLAYWTNAKNPYWWYFTDNSTAPIPQRDHWLPKSLREFFGESQYSKSRTSDVFGFDSSREGNLALAKSLIDWAKSQPSG